jgi:hypothetical protein
MKGSSERSRIRSSGTPGDLFSLSRDKMRFLYDYLYAQKNSQEDVK